MKIVTVREAQHHLSKVLKIVGEGDEVILTRRGKEVAKITAIDEGASDSKKVNWGEVLDDIKKQLKSFAEIGRFLRGIATRVGPVLSWEKLCCAWIPLSW